MSTWVIVLVAVWLAVMVFVWKRGGLGKGRVYGNQLAAHLGWQKNFFHSVLDLGTGNTSLSLLTGIAQAGATPHDATVMLAPQLASGLKALEARFGTQPQIAQAWPTVEKLVDEWDARRNAQK